MFTYQSPQMNQALWLAGLPNQSVSTFQNLVGQCRAPLVHRGPVQFDYTRPEMRLITPGSGAKYKDGPLEEPQNFPEQPEEMPEDPAPLPRPPEQWMPPEHFPNDPPPRDNDGPPGGGGFPRPGPDYAPGKYIRIENKVISLIANDPRRHCVFPNGKNVNNTINSIDFKGISDKADYIDLKITDNPRDTTFKIEVKKLEQVDIVTSVELDLASAQPAIKFNKKRAWVFDPEDIAGDSIDITACVEASP